MLPKEAKVPWQPAPVRWISSQITGLVSGTSWTEVGRLAIGQFWDGARTTNAFSAETDAPAGAASHTFLLTHPQLRERRRGMQ